jgi:hypothetical protein
MNKFYKLLAWVSAFALPSISLAQVPGGNIGGLPGGNRIQDILGVVSQIFGIIIPLLVTVAVIYVIVNVIKYTTASDEDSQATARKGITSGVIALFVIVSIWGLVAILNQTFGIGQGGQNIGNCQPVYNPATNTFVPPPGC